MQESNKNSLKSFLRQFSYFKLITKLENKNNNFLKFSFRFKFLTNERINEKYFWKSSQICSEYAKICLQGVYIVSIFSFFYYFFLHFFAAFLPTFLFHFLSNDSALAPGAGHAHTYGHVHVWVVCVGACVCVYVCVSVWVRLLLSWLLCTNCKIPRQATKSHVWRHCLCVCAYVCLPVCMCVCRSQRTAATNCCGFQPAFSHCLTKWREAVHFLLFSHSFSPPPLCMCGGVSLCSTHLSYLHNWNENSHPAQQGSSRSVWECVLCGAKSASSLSLSLSAQWWQEQRQSQRQLHLHRKSALKWNAGCSRQCAGGGKRE